MAFIHNDSAHSELTHNCVYAMSLSLPYCLIVFGVIAFQIALIFGALWGRLTQGGQTEGPLPLSIRLIAAASIPLLLGMTLAVLSADGNWPFWPTWTM